MKSILNIFATLSFIIILISCNKTVDPSIEFYVSAKESTQYIKAEFNHGAIYFYQTDEDGGLEGGSNLQMYDGIDIEIDFMDNPQSVLVANSSHWSGTYSGIRAGLGQLTVTRLDGTTFTASAPITAVNNYFGDGFQLEDNGSYRIEFVYDLDASISESSSGNSFDAEVEIKFERLD